jgi:hypothetical protein
MTDLRLLARSNHFGGFLAGSRARHMFFIAETPAVSCILTGANSGRQGWPIQQQAFSINRIGGLRTGPGLGEL